METQWSYVETVVESSPGALRIERSWKLLSTFAFGELPLIMTGPSSSLCSLSHSVSRGGSVFSHLSVWKAYGLDTLRRRSSATPLTIKLDDDQSSVTVSTSWTLSSSPDSLLPLSIPCLATYTLRSNHTITLCYRVDFPRQMPPPPRIGLRMSLPDSFSAVSWLGCGPHEAYDDRKSCVATGFYHSPVKDLHTPYIVPQECGRRHDPRSAPPFLPCLTPCPGGSPSSTPQQGWGFISSLRETSLLTPLPP
jgi:hypothetical protein